MRNKKTHPLFADTLNLIIRLFKDRLGLRLTQNTGSSNLMKMQLLK
jgi:hypothetical protein